MKGLLRRLRLVCLREWLLRSFLLLKMFRRLLVNFRFAVEDGAQARRSASLYPAQVAFPDLVSRQHAALYDPLLERLEIRFVNVAFAPDLPCIKFCAHDSSPTSILDFRFWILDWRVRPL